MYRKRARCPEEVYLGYYICDGESSFTVIRYESTWDTLVGRFKFKERWTFFGRDGQELTFKPDDRVTVKFPIVPGY